MWINPIIHTVAEDSDKNLTALNIDNLSIYSEENDMTTDNGGTLSSVMTMDHSTDPPSFTTAEEESFDSFEKVMKDPENTRVSKYQNTYFMDGGNRFISVSLSPPF
ncbi:hypothetical protein G6F56_013850 [Rhizopus delemar]|nr:hypothetical protein G6F56_013850 [Rhizopus delemar]